MRLPALSRLHYGGSYGLSTFPYKRVLSPCASAYVTFCGCPVLSARNEFVAGFRFFIRSDTLWPVGRDFLLLFDSAWSSTHFLFPPSALLVLLHVARLERSTSSDSIANIRGVIFPATGAVFIGFLQDCALAVTFFLPLFLFLSCFHVGVILVVCPFVSMR